MLRLLTKRLIFFPLRCVAEVIAVLFDMIVSRYLVAAVIVGLFWVPSHFLFGAKPSSFLWPTVILGVAFCGLWDGCEVFTIRDYLAKYGIVRSRDS
jgi:hypothetical protein